MSNVIHAGELNRRVGLYNHTKAAGSTAERQKTDNLLRMMWVKRIDVSGTEEEEGKVLPLKVCRFITKFSQDLILNGESYFLRDIDGDFKVNSVLITGQGRNRFLELKCSSRGKD